MENVKNSVRLTGFAGADPVITSFANDKKRAKVSIGISEYSAGSSTKQTQWISLIFWNKKVELLEDTVQKGTQFSIEGKLNITSYTDKNNEKKYVTEVIVNSLELIEG